jgi:hypothetical protein
MQKRRRQLWRCDDDGAAEGYPAAAGGGRQAAGEHPLELRRRLEQSGVGRGEVGWQAAHLAATCMVSGEELRLCLAWIPPEFLKNVKISPGPGRGCRHGGERRLRPVAANQDEAGEEELFR